MKHIKTFEDSYSKYPDIWMNDYVICNRKGRKDIFDYCIGEVVYIVEGPTGYYTYEIQIGDANDNQMYSRDEILLHSHDLEELKMNKDLLSNTNKFNL